MGEILLSELLKKEKKSYGIVAYLEFPLRILLAYPGGPEYPGGHRGFWSIPKGGSHGEIGWNAAVREFKEETNLDIPQNIGKDDAINLGKITQRSGKIVEAWGVEMEDDDISHFKSNMFKMIWPPTKNGTEQQFPEVDKVKWFSYRDAVRYIRYDQRPFLIRLQHELDL